MVQVMPWLRSLGGIMRTIGVAHSMRAQRTQYPHSD